MPASSAPTAERPEAIGGLLRERARASRGCCSGGASGATRTRRSPGPPYRLAIDIFGVGFKTADRIAGQLGISSSSPERAEAGVLHVLGEISGEGHVFHPRRKLVEVAARLLEIDDGIIEQVIETLTEAGQAVVTPIVDGEEDHAVYLKSLHTAESGTAALLCALLGSAPTPIAINIERALRTVHTFQGSERSVIIWDLVEMRNHRIGRLYRGKEGDRLTNVAITRAKRKLVVLGDPEAYRAAPGSEAVFALKNIVTLQLRRKSVRWRDVELAMRSSH